MKKIFARFAKDESGATAIEYGLIAALMAVVVIAAVALLGPQLEDTFEGIGNTLLNADEAYAAQSGGEGG